MLMAGTVRGAENATLGVEDTAVVLTVIPTATMPLHQVEILADGFKDCPFGCLSRDRRLFTRVPLIGNKLFGHLVEARGPARVKLCQNCLKYLVGVQDIPVVGYAIMASDIPH